MKTAGNGDAQGVRVGPTAYGLGVFGYESFCGRSAWPDRGPGLSGRRSTSPYYCMELGEAGCIEPDAPFRFLNHSCQPNCCLLEFEVVRPSGALLRELWPSVEITIEPGEQMTIDYGWPAEHAIPCHCGSPTCRQWIVAAEELQQVRREGGLSESELNKSGPDRT